MSITLKKNRTRTERRLDEALHDLRAAFGERISTGQSVREIHGRDESWHPPALPDAVVFPRTTEEISFICQTCTKYGVPIIAFGAGSSIEGALIPVEGGIVVSTVEMKQLLDVDSISFNCTVQPGLCRRELNEQLRDTGLFFTVDPGADASIGGMVATRASGTNTVRYGTMADAVLGLEVVLADGRVIKTGSRARKSAAGYDLTHLFTGSEGTLGIVTKITLKLAPLPETIASATCAFSDLENAVEAAVAVIGSGMGVARIELLDELMIAAVNDYSKTDLPVSPHLFLEFHGTTESTRAEAELAASIAADYGGEAFQWTTKAEDRNRLWRARHDCAYACMASQPSKRMLTTDVCVPRSALTECILQSRRDAEEKGLSAPVLGHVGDGNFHMALLIDPEDRGELAAAKSVASALVERALAAGGTATGEHGIGLGKRDYMRREHGDNAVDMMAGIKALFDPDNLLNPGKVLPD
ncbi:FAD-binding oxidoreductase [Notoacmeibacter ruber]|uniref:D-lactate dehydrogenase (cytochrome) n=1 Tax=Notoacmeibacter ruber TaxID=2670375 RepID=A0A3L7JC97_9HYPH|nr:FAD-linked oxidase C-terminal domain-containing protein [Notoacmeibacter ruber]RLQ88276.1 FAD-binding protein [Notoacmeibacter ruber]